MIKFSKTVATYQTPKNQTVQETYSNFRDKDFLQRHANAVDWQLKEVLYY